MTQNALISSVACVCLIFDVLFRLCMAKKTLKLYGKCLMPLSRKKSPSFLLVAGLSVVLAVFVYKSDYSAAITLILSACAVLALDITLRDFLLRAKHGVYENALVADGRQILRAKIRAFPTLAYENTDENASSLPPEVLQIVSDDAGILIVRFSSPEERNAAVSLMKDWPESASRRG